jgi:hypothetical protein
MALAKAGWTAKNFFKTLDYQCLLHENKLNNQAACYSRHRICFCIAFAIRLPVNFFKTLYVQNHR